jgi:hypothetical protein
MDLIVYSQIYVSGILSILVFLLVTPTGLHGVTTQKINSDSFTAVRTSDLI